MTDQLKEAARIHAGLPEDLNDHLEYYKNEWSARFDKYDSFLAGAEWREKEDSDYLCLK